MGKKSDRRDARTIAAQQRDNEWFQRGISDVLTVNHLRSLPERRLIDVQAHALATARKRQHPEQRTALVTLGALAKLVQERMSA
jgi:hypothetical protein